jgi:hypothetical protein
MLLSVLLETYNPVYPNGGSWEDTKNLLLSDKIEANIVHTLAEELTRDKQFKEPIRIGMGYGSLNPNNPNAEEEDDWLEVPYVLNGTHRVVAHMITGIQEVKVLNDADIEDEDTESESYYPWLETEIQLAEDHHFVIDDDLVFGALRSFRLNPTTWVEADLISGSIEHGKCSLVWHDLVDLVDFNELNVALQQRMESLGYLIPLENFKTAIAEYEDYED